MVQGVAAWFSVLRCVAVWCNVLQFVLLHQYLVPISKTVNIVVQMLDLLCCRVLQCVAVCCSVLQRTPCSVLQCVAVCCSVLQCVLLRQYLFPRSKQVNIVVLMLELLCCSVLQCVAVCYSVL